MEKQSLEIIVKINALHMILIKIFIMIMQMEDAIYVLNIVKNVMVFQLKKMDNVFNVQAIIIFYIKVVVMIYVLYF